MDRQNTHSAQLLAKARNNISLWDTPTLVEFLNMHNFHDCGRTVEMNGKTGFDFLNAPHQLHQWHLPKGREMEFLRFVDYVRENAVRYAKPTISKRSNCDSRNISTLAQSITDKLAEIQKKNNIPMQETSQTDRRRDYDRGYNESMSDEYDYQEIPREVDPFEQEEDVYREVDVRAHCFNTRFQHSSLRSKTPILPELTQRMNQMSLPEQPLRNQFSTLFDQRKQSAPTISVPTSLQRNTPWHSEQKLNKMDEMERSFRKPQQELERTNMGHGNNQLPLRGSVKSRGTKVLPTDVSVGSLTLPRNLNFKSSPLLLPKTIPRPPLPEPEEDECELPEYIEPEELGDSMDFQRPLPEPPTTSTLSASDDESTIEKWILNITREQSKQWLEGRIDGTFFFRPTKVPHCVCTLVVMYDGVDHHINVRSNADGTVSLGRQKNDEVKFKQLDHIVDYFTQNKLKIVFNNDRFVEVHLIVDTDIYYK